MPAPRITTHKMVCAQCDKKDPKLTCSDLRHLPLGWHRPMLYEKRGIFEVYIHPLLCTECAAMDKNALHAWAFKKAFKKQV